MSASSHTNGRSVFYDRFERHAGGVGLKGTSTHYCPGCGHGLLHRMIAEAIDELGIQDRTVAVSPVGCSVFLYYYMDVGNTQAAHGRAPAVAIGQKLAHPSSIVISYQGDGDLASIGLAEILHAAQLGVPITVIFVNNAIYGMTGGQMAPTTLMGQKTATTPTGRHTGQGQPLRMAEMVAGLDGPVYVTRTALYDQRTRKATRKAIRKALQLQMEGRGFAFVEVLSECPTQWKMTPAEAEDWVKSAMTETFPLGTFKDDDRDPWFDPTRPRYEPAELLDLLHATPRGEDTEAAPFPTHLDPHDVALKLAGAGGDGAQTAALLLTKAAIRAGFDATHIPSYGPESRGGTSHADVHVAQDEVLSPAAPTPHVLVAFNAPSLARFGGDVVPGGIVIYDTSVIVDPPDLPDRTVIGVPLTEVATELGNKVVKNVVALGALVAATDILPGDVLLATIEDALGRDEARGAMNREAFRRGQGLVRAGSGTPTR
jgi:2-oxoisovalerate ferredoxin oxidoreductase beta subunit